MEHDGCWRRLRPADAGAVFALREAVLTSLRDADHYVREADERHFVLGHLGTFGESFGCFCDDRLIAYGALTTAIAESGEIDEFAACAPDPRDVVFAAMMVHPDHRDRGLHHEGIRVRLRWARDVGGRLGLSQVSAANLASLRALLGEGFVISRAVEHPDGRRRLLLTRRLADAPTTPWIEDLSFVEPTDFEALRAELSHGRTGRALIGRRDRTMLLVGSNA